MVMDALCFILEGCSDETRSFILSDEWLKTAMVQGIKQHPRILYGRDPSTEASMGCLPERLWGLFLTTSAPSPRITLIIPTMPQYHTLFICNNNNNNNSFQFSKKVKLSLHQAMKAHRVVRR
jgi:hypothetical protein